MILWYSRAQSPDAPPVRLLQTDTGWQIADAPVAGTLSLQPRLFDALLPPVQELVTTGDVSCVLSDWLRFIPPQLGITTLPLSSRSQLSHPERFGFRLTDAGYICDTRFSPAPLPDALLCGDTVRLRLTRRDPPDVQRGFTACDYFDILAAGERVGTCSLRAGYHSCLYVNGHIGYTIFPAHRGHHYAAHAVVLLLQAAKQWRLPSVHICCVPENIASRRTCELAGLSLDAIVPVPADHSLFARGVRSFCRYTALL